MKDYTKFIWKKKFVCLFSMALFFFLGYFITSYFINNNREEFSATVYYEEEYSYINDKDLIEESLTSVLSSKGVRLITDEQIEKLLKNNNIYFVDLEDGFTICIKAKHLDKVESRAVKFVNNLCSNLNEEYVFDGSVEVIKHINPYYIGSYSMILGLILILLYLFSLYKNNDKSIIDISDNKEIFSSIFHKRYWSLACKTKLKVKDMCIIAVLFSMIFVGKSSSIFSGFGTMKINITYVFFAVICWMYGPIIGLGVGFFSDILGYFIFPPSYGFFFGYTISAMLTGFVYGICLYKTKVTFSKVFLSRVIVSLLINVVLGSIWWGIMSDFTLEQTKTYMLFTSLPKNIIYLVPQSILLYIVCKGLGRVFIAGNLMDKRICENITIL